MFVWGQGGLGVAHRKATSVAYYGWVQVYSRECMESVKMIKNQVVTDGSIPIEWVGEGGGLGKGVAYAACARHTGVRVLHYRCNLLTSVIDTTGARKHTTASAQAYSVWVQAY